MVKYSEILATAILAVLFPLTLRAQEATRHIWDTAFLAPKAEKKTEKKADKPHYTVLTPKVPVERVDPSTVVGITVWRLREAKVADGGERILDHSGSKSVELEPRRVSARTLFQKDDKVRITLETAREGYLYIVDREKYSNGKQGEPYLIFPMTTIHGGQNRVLPGHLVELPAQDDDPPYFGMERSRPDQVGEQLTVLITPSPLEDIETKDGKQRLSPEQFARLEQNSHVDDGMAEMPANMALHWSKDEKNAGRDPAVALPADAPLPQTLFYSPASSTQSATMVKLVLNYAPPVRPKR